MLGGVVMSVTIETIEDIYSRDGFVFPINAVSENEAKKIRADLELSLIHI